MDHSDAPTEGNTVSDNIQQQLQLCFSTLQQIAGNLSVSLSAGNNTEASRRSQSVLSTANSNQLSLPSVSWSGNAATVTAVTPCAGRNPTRMSVFQEHRNVFRDPTRHTRIPFHPYRRPTRPPMWCHNFLCLSSHLATYVPKREEKDRLSAAGLGEKRVEIGLQASSSQLRDKLLIVFPKLRLSDKYDLLRCLPNSRSLVRLVPPSEGFTPASLKEQVGAARIYIRPERRDLPLHNEEEPCSDSDTQVCCPDQSLLSLSSSSVSITSPTINVLSPVHCMNTASPVSSLNVVIPSSTVASFSSLVTSSSSPPTTSVSSPPTTSVSSPPTTSVFSPPTTSVSQPPTTSVSSPPTTSSSLPRPTTSSSNSPPLTVSASNTMTSVLPSSSNVASSASFFLLPELVTVGSGSSSTSLSKSISVIHDIFPQISVGQSSLLFSLYNGSYNEVIDVLADGITASSLLTQFKRKRMVTSSQLIQVHPEYIVRDGLFKGNFDMSVPIEIELEGAITVDLGGPRRQFFTEFLREMPKQLCLIEENGPIHFLTCNTDSIFCNHYKRFAQVIIYSILQEGPGYPHLPKALYYYFIGGLDMAVQYLSVQELPPTARHVVDQILAAETNDQLLDVEASEFYSIVSTGVTNPLKMTTKDVTIQYIMLNTIFYSRKAAIDQFMEGLCSLQFSELIFQFPEKFEPLFVNSDGTQPTPFLLLEMLSATCENDDEIKTFSFLKAYVTSLNSQECKQFLRFCTGSESIPPLGFDHSKITVDFKHASCISSSTCFHQLTLPIFDDSTTLAMCMNAAIECTNFNAL